MILREKQCLFAKLLGELIGLINSHAAAEGDTFRVWEVALAEGYVGLSIDKPSEDTPHLRHGNHFNKLAHDLDLFVDGKYIEDGSHPVWQEIGEQWESMHPLCRWGGRFKDANHFSLEHDGKA